MYEELIQRLRTCGNSLSCNKCKWRPECDGISNSFRKAADAIEELSRDVDITNEANTALYCALPKWIPVTEKLPECAGVYLCRIKSFNGDFRYTDTMKYVDGFFYEQGVATDRITHWMPLPEPPKEEKHADFTDQEEMV